VAIVGSKHIKQSDIEGLYLQQRLRGVPAQSDLKCSIFEELLIQKLLMNQAEVDSIIVEPSEVDMQMNRRLDEIIRRVGSQEHLEKAFNKSIYEIRDDLRIMTHEHLVSERMRSTITENVRITPSEVRSFYNRIPRDSVPFINGQVQVAQIVMYPPYSDDVISELRQNLLEMRRRVIEGERFSTLARMYSECVGSAMRGGDMDFISRGEVDPEFAKAAWSLKNPGDVSRIVVSKFGYHIIQLEERRGDQVRVRHILMTPKPNPEAVTTVTGRLDTIARFVRKDSLNWNVAVSRFSQDENTRFNSGLMINPRDHSTLFEMDQLEKADFDVIKNLKIGEISAPFESRDERNRIVYKVVKLVNQSDPRRANLREDYAFLQEYALHEKMHNTIMDWVNEKIETSYIYINDGIKRCGLSNPNWLKQ